MRLVAELLLLAEFSWRSGRGLKYKYI